MKFLDKLGLALFSALVLVIAIVLCLIGLGGMEPTIFSILISRVLISQTATNIMIGVCVFLILLAIRCLFFSDSDKKESDNDGILLQNEDGRLLITTDTLKDMVDGVVKEFPEITANTTNVIITKENDITIEEEIDVKKKTVIKEVSSKLQITIKKSIKDTTDLDIKYVNVRVRNAEVILNEAEKSTKAKIIDESKEEEEILSDDDKTISKQTSKKTENKAKAWNNN